MKILLICHEASYSGAPLVVYNFLRWIQESHVKSIEFEVLFLKDGPLKEKFKDIVKKVYLIRSDLGLIGRIKQKINVTKSIHDKIKSGKYNFIYCNSIASFDYSIFLLQNSSTKLILHVHEMEHSFKINSKLFITNKNRVSKFICVSEKVSMNLQTTYGIDKNKIQKITPFFDLVGLANLTNNNIKKNSESDKNKIFNVCASGNLYWAKNPDSFLQVAMLVKKLKPNQKFKFSWIGAEKGFSLDIFRSNIKKSGLENEIEIIDKTDNPYIYFNSCDIFLLTSIEDSFPLVCLEAGFLAKPIICFENATGITEILKHGGGKIIPFLDNHAMAEAIIEYANNSELLLRDSNLIFNTIKSIDLESIGKNMLACFS
jgi:glycosyltransferase involved in cell wall biosynthesis